MARTRPAPFTADEDLRGRDLRKADLRRCDLGGRDLGQVDLTLADLRGANLEGARLEEARLAGARLRGCCLVDANLHAALLRDADLTGADLHRANLGGADLAGAMLHGARLEQADLEGARLAGLSFRQVSLCGAILRQADLTGAQLIDGELEGADLAGATLGRADLSFADLREAILNGADLQDANLSGANLDRADLRNAEVKGARLSWVIGLDPDARRELRQRGARVPLSWLAGPWAHLNSLARRHAALFYLASLVAVTALAIGIALWVGQRTAGGRVYRLPAPGEGVVHEVECGTADDPAFRGKAGHVGGAVGRAPRQHGPVQRASQAPAQVYLTERHGQDFGYRFRVSPGWYAVELHFIELHYKRRGERTFDISIEDQVVERNFDILSETYPGTALVRSWATFVDDGFLDVHFKRRRGLAKVNFVRVRRLDGSLPARKP